MTNINLGLTLDDFEDFEDGSISITSKQDIIKNDNVILLKRLSKYVVDMGLPSRTLWGRYNLGVDIYQPLEIASQLYGHRYTWGETKSKDMFTWDTYKNTEKCEINDDNTQHKITVPNNCIIDIDGSEILDLKDDAAYNEMCVCGTKPKIPTVEQFKELLQYSNFLPVRKLYGIGPEHIWDKSVESLDGLILISKINKNQIFFPINGYYNGSQFLHNCGLYWTANQSKKFLQAATAISINIPKIMTDPPTVNFVTQEKRLGLSIRPVINIM